MRPPLLERIKQFQEHVLEVGLAQAVLALPAPRMLALPNPSEGAGISSIYAKAVTEFEIESVSRDLFASGHYSLAVQEAFKAVEKYVQRSRPGAWCNSGAAIVMPGGAGQAVRLPRLAA
jgi:hypothetical protein